MLSDDLGEWHLFVVRKVPESPLDVFGTSGSLFGLDCTRGRLSPKTSKQRVVQRLKSW